MVCRSCGQSVEREHRYCPWCAAPQRRKVVALFPPHPDVEASGRGLRVSRYFDPADGPPHTRMSIYGADGRIACVVALDDRSTTDLAAQSLRPPCQDVHVSCTSSRRAARGSFRGLTSWNTWNIAAVCCTSLRITSCSRLS